MFTPPLPSAKTLANPGLPRPERLDGATDFGSLLAGASRGLGGIVQDPAEDEADALRELCRLLSLLSCASLDLASLSPKPGSGPQRHQVEQLKAFLRKWTGCAEPGSPEAEQSLNTLFENLPPEIRAILLRVFPHLQERLAEERALLLAQRTETSVRPPRWTQSGKPSL